MQNFKVLWFILSLILSSNSLLLQASESNEQAPESEMTVESSIGSQVGSQVGNIAPDFSVTNLDGKTFKLSDYRGKKPVYLVFWATWCPTCKHEIPQLTELYKNLGTEVEILAINVDFLSWWSSLNTSNNRVEKYVKKYDIAYAVALDDEENLISLYQVRGTPTQLLIDKEGVVRRRYGLLNEKTIMILNKVLEEQVISSKL
jgi:thiol-disulfide isomerase/thioredoxin